MPRARRLLRVVTWNIHRGVGLFHRRSCLGAVARVLQSIGADVVALQEVVSLENGAAEADQARYLADELGLQVHHGTNRMIGAARYGNVVLTALAGGPGCNYDLSHGSFERRGCLRVDLDVGGRVLHVLNVHLGVSLAERHAQARLLERSGILDEAALPGPRVVVGDFNEWGRTRASALLGSRLERARSRELRGWPWSYPGLLPVVNIDRVYHDRSLRLLRLAPARSLRAMLASDHVPLVADFELP